MIPNQHRCNPTLELIETLQAVALHGSFATAADGLCCTPSAVSYRVLRLEALAGRVLWERRPGRLTRAGEKLLKENGYDDTRN
jgi:DNA-binding transcriptional LysR family regulator